MSAIGVCSIHTRSQVIFDIPRNCPILVGLCMILHCIVKSKEFGKNHLHRFTHDIGQNIQTTTVGHTKNKTVSTKFTCSINRGLQCRNNGFSSVQTKALRSIEFESQKVFKGVRKTKTFINVKLLFFVILQPTWMFNPFSNPVAPHRITNVHIFDSKCSTVSLSEFVKDHPKSHFTGHAGKFFKITFVSSGMNSTEIQLPI
mmetsp:Transcript_4407/g.8496  ORF Transcript_4407/g.8496 Transcript_4407/m.8496 type:complete len:201 (-) Transcript_4407:728-1330(-)